MQKIRRYLLAPLLLASVVGPAMDAAQAPETTANREFAQTVQPVLAAYCTSCHTGEKAAAQLDLRQYTTAESVIQDFAKWERVRAKLASRQMPPPRSKQPSEQERRQIISWIRSEERRVGKECRSRCVPEHDRIDRA